MELSDGERIPADLVVIAAGIRANSRSRVPSQASNVIGALLSTTTWKLPTRVFLRWVSAWNIGGETFGLVAPLFEQGKVLAATITGNRGPTFEGWAPVPRNSRLWESKCSRPANSSKHPARTWCATEDPGSGVYKKLLVRNNRLAGCVLVGDASDSNRYMEWLRSSADLEVRRRQSSSRSPCRTRDRRLPRFPTARPCAAAWVSPRERSFR